MLIEYKKTRNSAQEPVRANPSDAGLDVFYCPEGTDSVSIPPGGNKVLDTSSTW